MTTNTNTNINTNTNLEIIHPVCCGLDIHKKKFQHV